MLLSEENERLRAELERMKSLAASLLGVPPARELERTPSQISGGQLMVPTAPEPSNAFQLSLSQPFASDFIGLSSENQPSKANFLNTSAPATVTLGSFPPFSGGGGRLLGLDHIPQGLQATGPQLNGAFDFPVVLSGGGGRARQQPVLGSSAYSLENLQAFAGDIRSAPMQKSQPMLPLLPAGLLGGGLPLLADPPAKQETKFVYPGISHIERKLSDHLKPFSPALAAEVPLASLPTTGLAAVKQEEAPGTASEGKGDSGEPKRRGGRKRERDSGDENRKMRLSKEQSQQLEAAFNEQSNHSPKQKNALALRLGLRPRQVEVWFQNRRARTKLKQTEIDCEVLKRCCETLTDENRRLQKEVVALKSRQSSSSGDDRRGFGADASAPVCLNCKEKIASAEAIALQIHPTEGGLAHENQESGLDSEQHTASM